jgi:hypothetical protein
VHRDFLITLYLGERDGNIYLGKYMKVILNKGESVA